MLNLGDIKSGVVLDLDDTPYVVKTATHDKRGRGAAVVRAKLKNIATGAVIERAFKSGDRIAQADLNRQHAQFLYREGGSFHFMNAETFDQFELPTALVGESAGYLVENSEYDLLVSNDQPIAVTVPAKVKLTVKEAAPGVRGDTAQGAVLKEAVLETGAKVRVPLFVEVGDTIVVNTETGEYVERA